MNQYDPPLVSCVINCFSSAATLPQALDSLLSQTYLNIEYIVVDNASVDETPTILKHYANKDSRVSLILNTEHINGYESWRMGIQQTSGDFAFLANDDDLWHPRFVEMLVAEFRDAVGVAFCNIAFFDNQSRAAVGSYDYFRAAQENPAIGENSMSGRRARLTCVLDKNLGSTKLSPSLFYAMYRGTSLREAAEQPFVWPEIGFVDERFIFAHRSFQSPWSFVDATLMWRRHGNTRPSPAALDVDNLRTQNPPPNRVRRVIFLRKLLRSEWVSVVGKVVIVAPLLLVNLWRAYGSFVVRKVRRAAGRDEVNSSVR